MDVRRRSSTASTEPDRPSKAAIHPSWPARLVRDPAARAQQRPAAFQPGLPPAGALPAYFALEHPHLTPHLHPRPPPAPPGGPPPPSPPARRSGCRATRGTAAPPSRSGRGLARLGGALHRDGAGRGLVVGGGGEPGRVGQGRAGQADGKTFDAPQLLGHALPHQVEARSAAPGRAAAALGCSPPPPSKPKNLSLTWPARGGAAVGPPMVVEPLLHLGDQVLGGLHEPLGAALEGGGRLLAELSHHLLGALRRVRVAVGMQRPAPRVCSRGGARPGARGVGGVHAAGAAAWAAAAAAAARAHALLERTHAGLARWRPCSCCAWPCCPCRGCCCRSRGVGLSVHIIKYAVPRLARPRGAGRPPLVAKAAGGPRRLCSLRGRAAAAAGRWLRRASRGCGRRRLTVF